MRPMRRRGAVGQGGQRGADGYEGGLWEFELLLPRLLHGSFPHEGWPPCQLSEASEDKYPTTAAPAFDAATSQAITNCPPQDASGTNRAWAPALQKRPLYAILRKSLLDPGRLSLSFDVHPGLSCHASLAAESPREYDCSGLLSVLIMVTAYEPTRILEVLLPLDLPEPPPA
jgi:hypothetical protein